MNLLEHYIEEIYEFREYNNTDFFRWNLYVEVDMLIVCHGHKERVKKIFAIEEWRKTIERGYYFA